MRKNNMFEIRFEKLLANMKIKKNVFHTIYGFLEGKDLIICGIFIL
jgi:hypothetical protein